MYGAQPDRIERQPAEERAVVEVAPTLHDFLTRRVAVAEVVDGFRCAAAEERVIDAAAVAGRCAVLCVGEGAGVVAPARWREWDGWDQGLHLARSARAARQERSMLLVAVIQVRRLPVCRIGHGVPVASRNGVFLG